jgi:pimeloyl-ACP methyl ester carboxylesterase
VNTRGRELGRRPRRDLLNCGNLVEPPKRSITKGRKTERKKEALTLGRELLRVIGYEGESQLALMETMLGNSFDDASRQWYFRLLQEGVTPELFVQLITLWSNMDVRDLLPKVSVPTLVVHCRHDRLIPFEAGRELAAGIPGARFVPLEGDAHLSISATRFPCDAR